MKHNSDELSHLLKLENDLLKVELETLHAKYISERETAIERLQ
jgi:hypothetical protein